MSLTSHSSYVVARRQLRMLLVERVGRKSMSKRNKTVVIIVLISGIVFGLMILSIYLQKVVMNPKGTVGNTAGNINNGGLFCEYNDTIYFSNSFDNGYLYAMDSIEGNIHKVNNVTSTNILAGGKYLYYYNTGTTQAEGFANIYSRQTYVRADLDGKNTTSLTSRTVITIQLVDDYLYFLTVGSNSHELHKIKIDKTEDTIVQTYMINPASVYNSTIYYNGTGNDHYLHALDTDTGYSSVVWQGNIWEPAVIGDWVYYMDVANNYRLCRYSISQNHIEVLTNDRIDCFNVGNDYIFYQKNSANTPQLIRMKTDGSESTVIAEGNYTAIHQTSNYVYFKEFGDEITLYHMPIHSTSYGVFQGARDAIPEK